MPFLFTGPFFSMDHYSYTEKNGMGRRRNDHRQLSFWTAPDEGFVAMAKGVKRNFHFRYK